MPLNRVLWILFFLFAPACCLVGAAQKRNNIWAFGDGAGLNFNTDPITPFKSKAEGIELPYYISSICDKNGNLLFYTDGVKIWNSYHKELPKHNNWWPWSEDVLPLICPYPYNDSLYYLFGVSDKYNANNLVYLTVKMQHSGDLEEAAYPTPVDPDSYYTRLLGNAALLLAGTHHCNEKDVWITAYSPGALNCFLITETGVSKTPVVTPVSTALIPQHKIAAGQSNIKFSANGEKLVVPLVEENKIVVFDFNKATGGFSNPVKLSLPAGYLLEDVEIAPDASKVYFGAYEIVDFETMAELHYVCQMDLNAGSASQVEKTLFKVNGLGDRAACSPRGACNYVHRTMQLGPDGSIYVNMNEHSIAPLANALSVIEHPDRAGRECSYRNKLVNLKKKYRFLNYSYIRSSNYTLKENAIQIQKKTCADKPVSFALYFKNVDSVKWDFGDPASGSGNTSASLNPQHQYPGPGVYQVTAIVFTNCLSDTTRKEVIVEKDLAVKVPESLRDTMVCVGGQLSLDATAAFAKTYTWENGLIYSTRTIDAPGHYQLTIGNDCSSDFKEFDVVQKECACAVFIPTAFTPNNDGLNDEFKPVVQCQAKGYQFRVINRYGQVVFETNETGKGWRGLLKNGEAPAGVYIWMVRYQNPNNKIVSAKNGTVVLIR